MRRPLVVLALAALPASTASGQADAAPLGERFDLTRRAAHFELPGRLNEVSGLAFTDDGRLFAHDDERAVLFAIEPRTGHVGRGFGAGSDPVEADFEGLAIAGERFFLISSRGLLYEFREAAPGTTSPVRVTDTGLGPSCEAEGLAFHGPTRSLLLACKRLAPPDPEVRVHRIPLDPAAPRLPPIRVPFSAFVPFGLGSGVHPSGLDVDPSTGTLVLVAAEEGALFEVDLQGRLLDVAHLGGRRHPQAEGLAIGPDGRLFIADEGRGQEAARITVYAPPVRKGRP